MRQQKTESVRLYLGRLKGATQQCDFTLLVGGTSYTDKMVTHTLLQGLEDATITKDVMEKYAIHNDHTTIIITRPRQKVPISWFL